MLLQGNNKPHINKSLRKAIMKRSRLKNIYNKTKNIDDYSNYKKQRNFVVNLNKQSKREFFKKVKAMQQIATKYFGRLVNHFSTISVILMRLSP